MRRDGRQSERAARGRGEWKRIVSIYLAWHVPQFGRIARQHFIYHSSVTRFRQRPAGSLCMHGVYHLDEGDAARALFERRSIHDSSIRDRRGCTITSLSTAILSMVWLCLNGALVMSSRNSSRCIYLQQLCDYKWIKRGPFPVSCLPWNHCRVVLRSLTPKRLSREQDEAEAMAGHGLKMQHQQHFYGR